MKDDTQTSMDHILDAVRQEGAIASRMLRLINDCETQTPHPDWQVMRQLNFEADRELIQHWLPRWTTDMEQYDGPFKGLWFGLFNPVENDIVTADLYVVAQPTYDTVEQDWASDDGPLIPSAYRGSQVLHAIYQAAYASDAGLRNEAEAPLALGYGLSIVLEALEHFTPAGSLSSLEGAPGGFDSGDLVHLGEFHDGRFRVNVRCG